MSSVQENKITKLPSNILYCTLIHIFLLEITHSATAHRKTPQVLKLEEL